ncbi:MAG: TRAP transporter small permease [Deltaproteobacteria bacterium]|nr:MAG: TRAP transporter small permease [Deltaproteobacteria bacterium]
MVRKVLYYLDKAITLFEEWTLFLTVTGALVTLFVSVAMRFGARYGITSTLAWPEEFVREVIVYSTFVGCVAAVKSRSLIRVDALPNIIKSWKKPLEVLSNISMVVFALFITWFGVKMALFQYKMGMNTIILKIPQVCLYSILPIMGIGMLCRLLQVFYEDITGIKVNDLEAGG